MGIVFWIAAVVALGAALGVVASRNPVHSAVALVLNLGALGVLFLLLHAEFLAVVEVLVYAGAVMVLFLFVITLLMAGTNAPHEVGRTRLAGQALIASILGLGIFVLVAHVLLGSARTNQLVGAHAGAFGSIAMFGDALFKQYLLPFELTAVVLLIAVIGVVVLGREQH